MQSAEQFIITARATIAKAEALIAINEQKLATARKKLEELKAARTQVEENLSTHSSKLESLRAQLAARKFLSEEEKARQHEIYRLREQIRSLANQDY